MLPTSTSTSLRWRVGSWLALAALCAVTPACGVDDGGASVHDFMESASEVEAVTLSDVYDREVSAAVIVCAYTGAGAIRDELGFAWSGAKGLADALDGSDSHQAVIAVHDGAVVESEVVDVDVLDLCGMDLGYPATIDAGTTVQLSWCSIPWSDGTTRRVPVASIE